MAIFLERSGVEQMTLNQFFGFQPPARQLLFQQESVQCGGKVVASKDGTVAKCAVGGAVDVVVNTAVKFVDNIAFRGLKHLKTVTLHSGIVGCRVSCFRECHQLHTIDFASCTMRDGTGATAAHHLSKMMFAECHALKTVKNWPTNSFDVGEAGLPVHCIPVGYL